MLTLPPKSEIPPDGLLARDVVKLTGATFRQLQWWDERGHVQPAHGHRRHRRIYAQSQMEQIKRFVELSNAHIHRIAERKKYLRMPAWQTIKVVSRATVVGSTLVVFYPRGTRGAEQPESRIARTDRELDALALRDPAIAMGRTR